MGKEGLRKFENYIRRLINSESSKPLTDDDVIELLRNENNEQLEKEFKMSTIKEDVQKLKDDIFPRSENEGGQRHNPVKEPYYYFTGILNVLERVSWKLNAIDCITTPDEARVEESDENL